MLIESCIVCVHIHSANLSATSNYYIKLMLCHKLIILVLTAGVRTMLKMVARLFGKGTEFLIRFEALTKLAQQWLVCVPLGMRLEPINKELMLLVELCSAK